MPQSPTHQRKSHYPSGPLKLGTQNPSITDDQLRKLVGNSSLTAHQRSTLLVLAGALNRYTLEITVSYDAIAKMLGLKRRATVSRMQSLERTGVIQKTRCGGGRSESGKGYTNTWVLVPSMLIQTTNQSDELSNGVCLENGAQHNTFKGAPKLHQGCSEPSQRVYSSAHNRIDKEINSEEIRLPDLSADRIDHLCHPDKPRDRRSSIQQLVRQTVRKPSESPPKMKKLMQLREAFSEHM
jgi:hypothetical protein